MADEGGERVRGRKVGDGTADGLVPTGSDLTSDGSSVELDADLATETEIPPTEEILRKGEEARRGRRVPPEAARPPKEMPEKKPFVPHDKGRMEEIE